MSGVQFLIHPHGQLAKETNDCRERLTEGARSHHYSEMRPQQISFWWAAPVPLGRAEECYEPETSCYAYRDSCPEQFLLGRMNLDTGWGTDVAAPLSAPVMGATAVTVDQACASHDFCYGAQHQPVTLDAPDVALRG